MQSILMHLGAVQQAELAKAVEKIVAATGAEKIFCFGHRSTQKTEWNLFLAIPPATTTLRP